MANKQVRTNKSRLRHVGCYLEKRTFNILKRMADDDDRSLSGTIARLINGAGPGARRGARRGR